MTIDRQATPPTHGRQWLKQSEPTEKEDSKPSNLQTDTAQRARKWSDT